MGLTVPGGMWWLPCQVATCGCARHVCRHVFEKLKVVAASWLLQAQATEVSRTLASKEAECRQLQDYSREQEQKLAEAAAAAEQQAAELTTLQVN